MSLCPAFPRSCSQCSEGWLGLDITRSDREGSEVRIVLLSLDQIENIQKSGYYILCLVQIEQDLNGG